MDDRKRKYNSLVGDEGTTAEDMEAYRMTRIRADDPLLQMEKGKGGEGGYV